MEATRTLSPCGGGANSSAALCGLLSPGKLWSLSAKEFAWHLGVHCAPCPFRQYVPIHSRPNSKGEHHVQLQKQRPPRRQPRQRRRKEVHPNGDGFNFSIAVNEQREDKDGAEHKN